jgi:uncharacterized secreted protein with C-terminal beta-propeller domain
MRLLVIKAEGERMAQAQETKVYILEKQLETTEKVSFQFRFSYRLCVPIA